MPGEDRRNRYETTKIYREEIPLNSPFGKGGQGDFHSRRLTDTGPERLADANRPPPAGFLL